MTGRRKRSKSPEKRRNRFKFKSFAERIEEIDIDVVHSLDAVKVQPEAEGSSFFYESLIQWRETNATGDFIELYGKLLPLVQTLPQLILHKATVIKLLVSFLRPSSPSLEPVFSLLGVLPRDLSEDFLPFIAEVFDGYYKLLQNGGDRDPTALQGFTLVAYIFKYMAKYLSKNLAFVLKVTRCFRFYYQDYVRNFAAEAVSFVFKIAPLTQVIKGIRRLISETEKDPTDERISSCGALLAYTLKGPSAGFHSRAEELLKLLFSPAIICGVREGSKGQTVLELLKNTLTDVCEETDPSKLHLLWSCLLDEILLLLPVFEESSTNWPEGSVTRMEQLLLILNHVSEYKKGRYMNDRGLFLSISPRLLNLVPKLTGESHKSLQLQAFAVIENAILKKADENIKPNMSAAAWTSVFECLPSTILFPYIKRLLHEDVGIIKPFELYILRALERHVETDELNVFRLLLALLQRLNLPAIASEKLSRVATRLLDSALEKLKNNQPQTSEETAVVLVAMKCVPHLSMGNKPECFCIDFATAIDQFIKESDISDAGTWASVLAAALTSHMKVLQASRKLSMEDLFSFINLGLKYAEFPDALEAVSNCALELQRLGGDAMKFPEALDQQAFIKHCRCLEKSLLNPSKRIRLASLRILSVFQQSPESAKILNDLLSIESSPLDIEHSRHMTSLILQVKMDIAQKPVELVRLVFHAMLGVLHNRFTLLWEPVITCVAEIMDAKGDNVRNDFMSYLSAIQNQCLQDSSDLSESHESQMPWNLMTLLLRIAQKTSATFASVSNEIVSVFLLFVNHKTHKTGDERPFLSKNDWKALLKEWLQFLVHLKSFSGLTDGALLKQILIERFLVFSDPDIQKKCLDCLLKWKDSCLMTYKDHLYKLVSAETMREELASWRISREDQLVADGHRSELIPVLIRILYPKLSKRHAKVGKSTGHMRSHILTFLSCLDIDELETFFSLIVRPLEAAFSYNGTSDISLAWKLRLEQNDFQNLIDWVDKDGIVNLPYKVKIGFLHLVKDILQAFDGDHLDPYLPALMAFVFRLLETASIGDSASSGKDIRTLCLKVISLLLDNFNNVNLGPKYWDAFFQAVDRSISLLKEENTNEKPTAILSCFLAMSTNTEFVSLLGRNKSVVPNIFSIMLVKNLSSSVHTVVLSFIQSLLAMDTGILELYVLPHLALLLQGLTQQLTRQLSSGKRWKADHLKEQLQIISSVSPFISDSPRASEFLNTLLPFLKTKKPDPEVRLEVLRIIRELAHLFDAPSAAKCVHAFTSLLSSVPCKDSRVLLCESLEKLAAKDSSFAPVAEILVDLNSMSTSRLDECDYERRQVAYDQKLNREFLSRVDSRQVQLLLSQIVFDLESEDMRYNASSSLVMFVRATGESVFKDNVADVVHVFLFSRITDAIKSVNPAIRREWLIIFRELVTLPAASMFAEYRCLWSSDVEADFFSNIIHIQLHRRIKAMSKFRAAASQFSQRSLTKVFAPLFLHFLFENKESNVIDAALDTLGCIAMHLQWSEAVNLVTDTFRLLRSKREHQKVLVRLICLLLERTQFSQMRDKEESKYLEHKVLPQLSKLLLVDESVNVPVSVVAIKVLKLLPEQVIMKHLPQMFQTITNVLKSRSEETRDQARSSIVGMVEVLGANYLQFAVKMLQSSLKRGYEKHVLGYTLNTILIRLIPSLQLGDIDYCVEDVMKILEDEIFGEVSLEKEVEALARNMKERKQARSYDSFRLVAQVVTFDVHIHRLLQVVREQSSSSSKVLSKLQLILNNVTAGVQENKSASDEKVLLFVRGLIEELLQPKADSTSTADGSGNSLHLLAEFGLNLLHDRLRRFQPTAEEISTLDAFVPLLERCLSVKYTGVVSGAMRCLSILLKLPLPAIPSEGERIVNSVFSLATSSSTTDSPLMQSCMKLLTVILRHCRSITLSKHQVHELLRLNVFVEIEKQGTQCLSLLKAIVARKLVVPEVYDLMTRIQKLMITSQHQSTRQRCSEILLQFFLDYPLAPKRLQRHIDFLLGNLGYEHISGREAALEMLHTVIVKFPDPVLKEQSQSFFLTLITRLANDKDSNVQVLLQTVLRILMERVGGEMLDHMKEFLLSWMNSDKQSLWLPATQATGLLVDVMDKNFERHLDDFWPAVLKVLDKSTEAHWRQSLNVLIVIEKVFQRFPDRLSQDVWQSIQEFLLHRNTSVRTVSTRLFQSYFESVSSSSTFFKDPRWLFLFGAICCEQMTSEDVDEELENHVIQNLTTVAAALSSVSLKLEDVQDDRVVKAFTILRQKGTTDQLMRTLAKNDFLTLLLRRLGKISFENLQAKCVLRWYTSFVSRLGKEKSAAYLPHILSPLLKVERSSAPAEVKTLAEEVREEIRTLVGPESFAKAFSEVSLEVKQQKEKRKRAKSIAALVDPEKTARKKIKLGQKRGAQKKRRRIESRDD